MSILFFWGLAIACYTDWKSKRIENWLIVMMAVLGVVFRTSYHGYEGLVLSIAGWLTGMALLFGPFYLGGVGGGDVKLLGAIGAFFGPYAVLRIFLASAVLGGIFSLVSMLRRGAFRQHMENIKSRALYYALTRQLPKESEIKTADEPVFIPYSFALAGGCIVFLVLGGT